MRISPETMRLLRMLGDLEALKVGESRAFFYDKRKGGKIWPVMSGTKHPAKAGPTKVGEDAYADYEGCSY